MPPDPPDSDDPLREYERKRLEAEKKRAEQAKEGSEQPGNGADAPKNGPDNVVPISQGRRRNTKPKPEPPDVKGIVETTSELALQRKFSDDHGESLKFIADGATGGRWFYWTMERWRQDTRGRIGQLIKEFLWTEARASLWVEEGKRLAHSRTVRNIEYLAQTDPRHATDRDLWDRDPMMLGTPTMAVDLRTGQVRRQWREDYLLRSTSVDPAEPGTPAPVWEKFLGEITNGNKDYRGFLQRLFGYFLTADISEEVFVFIYGKGGRGKGTLIRTIAAVMGDYWGTVKKELLVRSSPYPSASDEYHKATMDGKRLITVQETEKDAKWSETELLELTGNDSPISARHPRGDPFTFELRAKIAILGNNKPKIEDRTDAMRRRLRTCPFTFKPRTRDTSLKRRLQAEAPQILRWLIDGAVIWAKKGLGSCNTVDTATSKYFSDQDYFGAWVDNCCVLDPDAWTRTTELRDAYNAWHRNEHEDADDITWRAFTDLVDNLDDVERTHKRDGSWTQGLRIRGRTYDPDRPPNPEV
jgi:putative DNA primase/helicase